MVKDCKILFNILIIYLPLPLFWALFDQQGSRWVSQAMKLNGNLSSFTIQPDQIQMANPFLILTFIPLCEFVLYPLLSFIGIRRPLQKMSLGGVLAAISFLCSMFLQLKIDDHEPQKICILWQLPQIAIMTLAEVIKYCR
jgi:solute carrier family 15 (oligopeptide transporter), member 1